MSNDDMFTWSDRTKPADNLVHINIVRNISSGNPTITGRHILPGANESFSNIANGNGAVLPNEQSALFGFQTGYFFIDFSNESNISSYFVNLSSSIPDMKNLQGINVLQDNITVVFSFSDKFQRPCFQEGIIQSNGSITLARSTMESNSYGGSMIVGVSVDHSRKILYCAARGELFILNLTSWTTPIRLKSSDPWSSTLNCAHFFLLCFFFFFLFFFIRFFFFFFHDSCQCPLDFK